MASPNQRNAVASAPAASPDVSLWRAIGASLQGRRQDFTNLPLSRAVLLLAVPMALELVMESTFGLVDIYFVGKLGPEPVAAVGLTGGLIILMFAIAMGLGIGAGAIVARRVGEGDIEGAATAAGQALLAGVGASLPFSAAGFLLAPRLLALMGASPDVVAVGAPYTAMMFGGSLTIFLIFLNNAIFRGAGDAAIAMRALWLANLVNMVLDPCLIFGLGPFPELGLFGAALATTLGRGLGVVFQFWALAKGDRRIRLRLEHLRFQPAVMRPLLKISMNGMLQFLIGTASWLGIMRIVALFGDVTLAGYTIGLRLIHFAILPSWGVSQAAATLVGQNLGAGRPDRAEQSVWLTARYNLILLGSMAVVFWLFAKPLVGVFTADEATLAAGTLALRISSFAYCFSAFSMVFSQAFNGAGDTWTPTKLNFFVMWLWQLPLAYTLSQKLGYGLAGVLVAVVISMATWALVGGILFRRGAWKHKKV
ncbi:MAG: MATE family efflux transporter [Acidobacteria bacterium]|nr:MATE family efflux transporter [Acidobacteriota bacterium]